MLRRLLPVLFVLTALFLFACAKTAVPPTNDAGPDTAKKASPAATPAATAPSTGKIGVPECDEYLAKVEACVSSKVPEAARAQYKTSIEASRKAWQTAAATPQGKAGLAAACKQATEAAKAAYKSYNCTF